LFNRTPKRCEGTEVNTVRKGISAINHTFAGKKICTHAMCILALKKLNVGPCVTWQVLKTNRSSKLIVPIRIQPC